MMTKVGYMWTQQMKLSGDQLMIRKIPGEVAEQENDGECLIFFSSSSHVTLAVGCLGGGTDGLAALIGDSSLHMWLQERVLDSSISPHGFHMTQADKDSMCCLQRRFL